MIKFKPKLFNNDDIILNLQNILENIQKSGKDHLFINAHNDDPLTFKIKDFITNYQKKFLIFEENINSTLINDPYFPFLTFLKKYFINKKSNISKSIRKANKYTPHKYLYESYLSNHLPNRYEQLIYDEIDFEIYQFSESITNFYSTLSHDKPILFFLNNFHFAPDSAKRILQKLIDSKKLKKVVFVILFNKNFKSKSEESNKCWKDFLTFIETKNVVYSSELLIQNNYSSNFEIDFLKKAGVKEIEYYIHLSYTNLTFLALEECKFASLSIFDYIQNNSLKISDKYYILLLEILSDVHFYKQENNSALYYANLILSYAQEHDSSSLIANTYRRLSYIEAENGNFELSYKFIKQNLLITEKSSDKISNFYSNLILVYLEDRIKMFGHFSVISKEKILKHYFEMIKMSLELNMFNALAFIYNICGFLQSTLDIPYSEALLSLEKSVKYSQKVNNIQRLSGTYELIGSIKKKADYKNNLIALNYNKKSLRLKKQTGNNLSIARAYNSIGYIYSITEEYTKAHTSFKHALNLLIFCNDLDEFIHTFYNMGRTFYNARLYDPAIFYFELSLQVMRILDIKYIRFFPIDHIYTFISLCYIQQNNLHKCLSYATQIKEIANIDSNFHYELLQALLAKYYKEYHIAYIHFKKIDKLINDEHILSTNIVEQYCTIIFYYEYGLVLKEDGKKIKAKKIFNTALQHCKEQNFTFYEMLVLNELSEEKIKIEPFKFKKVYIDSKFLIDIIHRKFERQKFEANLHQLNKRINEINFLNNIQIIFSKYYTKQEIINEFMELVHRNFIVEFSVVFIRESDLYTPYYTSINSHFESHSKTYNKLLDHLLFSKKKVLIKKTSENKEFGFLKEITNSLISLPIIHENKISGIIICTTQKDELFFTADDLRILNIASKQLSDALERIDLIDKLKELDSLKNDFIANVTHDFRSPLTVVLNLADLAINYSNNIDEESSEKFKLIYKAAIKLKDTVDRLLNLARMDARGVKINISKLTIVTFLMNIVDFYKSSLIANNISINSNLPDYEIDNIYSDYEKLEEVINNIISNAIKFADHQNGKIKISLVDKEKSIVIKISDNGIGIDAKHLKSIFNRFEQVESGRNSIYKGTGIGLSFSKQLVEYLQGKIWAKSSGAGKGSTFYIELFKGKEIFKDYVINEDEVYNFDNLINRDEIKSILEVELEEKSKNNSNKIQAFITDLNNDNEFDEKKSLFLIVEDNINIQHIIMSYLKNNGYQNFILTANGEDGLHAAYHYHPDIIISDFNMPKMKGDKFYEQIKNNPNLSHVHFIFLTALTDQKYILKQKEKGIISYLKKPIDQKNLTYTVKNHLEHYYKYKRLLTMVTIDELSGLNNKKTFFETLIKELSIREYRDISIIHIDIKNFNNINLVHGYNVGDEILKLIGETLNKTVRTYDTASRFSNDDFFVLLPNNNKRTSAFVAKKFCTKILKQIRKYNEDIIVDIKLSTASLKECEKKICELLNINNLKDVFEVADPDNTDWDMLNSCVKKIAEVLVDIARGEL